MTSGAYERFYVRDGAVWHHIFDPNTGRPSQGDLLSVTLVGQDGALLDALATTIFITGLKQGYSGTGTGFRGDTNVIVTVENHTITGITIESYRDDQRFFEQAKDKVISAIISEQSLNVDTVSGATFSSNGNIEAVANALGMSYSNPNSNSPQKGHGPKGGGDWQPPASRGNEIGT